MHGFSRRSPAKMSTHRGTWRAWSISVRRRFCLLIPSNGFLSNISLSGDAYLKLARCVCRQLSPEDPSVSASSTSADIVKNVHLTDLTVTHRLAEHASLNKSEFTLEGLANRFGIAQSPFPQRTFVLRSKVRLQHAPLSSLK